VPDVDSEAVFKAGSAYEVTGRSLLLFTVSPE
jgi:hypothetical protein